MSTENASSLAGQAALVTGASSGIGRAIAIALARHGAELCLVGRDRDRLDQVARACPTRAIVRAVDLTAETATIELAGVMEKEFGGVDVLVHSAGRFAAGATETVPASTLDELYGVNARAPYRLTRALLRGLRARRGQVVFVSSSVVRGARGGVGQYAASKLALQAIADSLRDEVNSDGIRVLSVYPGRTATPMQEEVVAWEGRDYHPEKLLQPEDVAQIVLAALLLPPTAEVTDLWVRPMKKN